jgi:hypothetical protein
MEIYFAKAFKSAFCNGFSENRLLVCFGTKKVLFMESFRTKEEYEENFWYALLVETYRPWISLFQKKDF